MGSRTSQYPVENLAFRAPGFSCRRLARIRGDLNRGGIRELVIGCPRTAPTTSGECAPGPPDAAAEVPLDVARDAIGQRTRSGDAALPTRSFQS